MNPFRFPMQAMQNQMIQQMQRQNPQLFQKIQEMTQGKNEVQLREIAQNIAKERKNKLKHYEDVASQIADLLAR